MLSQLSICLFVKSSHLLEVLRQGLQNDRYILLEQHSEASLLEYLRHKQHTVDCLILEDNDCMPDLIRHLNDHKLLFPSVIILNQSSLESNFLQDQSGHFTNTPNPSHNQEHDTDLNHLPSRYHAAEVLLWDYLLISSQESDGSQPIKQTNRHLEAVIDKAIVQFLQLSPVSWLRRQSILATNDNAISESNYLLLQQQQRLAEKLKERLGYLGVYYKRDSQQFLRHLPPGAAQELLRNLRLAYREIILN